MGIIPYESVLYKIDARSILEPPRRGMPGEGGAAWTILARSYPPPGGNPGDCSSRGGGTPEVAAPPRRRYLRGGGTSEVAAPRRWRHPRGGRSAEAASKTLPNLAALQTPRSKLRQRGRLHPARLGIGEVRVQGSVAA